MLPVVCDPPGGGWNRARIDLNGNDRQEEKITIVSGRPTKRQVALRDDETCDLECRWRDARWVAGWNNAAVTAYPLTRCAASPAVQGGEG